MQVAIRSYLATGVAIAGVGALAVSPVAPPLPDVAVPAVYSTASVELASLVNPFQEFAVVFNVALQNAGALANRIAENPTPILSQIVANQVRSATGIANFVGAVGESVVGQLSLIPGELEEAVGQLAAGNITVGLNTILSAVLGPVVQVVVDTLLFNPEIWIGLQNAIQQPFQNLVNVIDLTSYPNVLNLLGPLLAPVQMLTDVTNAIGAAGDGIVSGVRNGDLEEIANALLSLGPDVAYAVLNGTPLGAEYSAGLLGPQGIIAGLLTIRDMVAAAITPNAAAKTLAVADSTVDTTAKTVTLEVAPAAEVAQTVEVAQEQSGGQASEPVESVVAEPVSVSIVPAAEPAAEEPSAEAPAAGPEDEAVTPSQDAVDAGETPAATDDDAEADAEAAAPAEGAESDDKGDGTVGGSDTKAGDNGKDSDAAAGGKRADSDGSAAGAE
jgi:hypothetical protein